MEHDTEEGPPGWGATDREEEGPGGRARER